MRTQENDLGHWVHPDGGPHPGVVMVPDVWGVSDPYRDLAGRLAGEGFAVLVADPYRKTGHPELTDVESALRWIRELPDPVVLDTLQEAVDALAAHPAVRGRTVGITGFCMGGMYALLAACTCSGLSACAPFYGMLRHEPGLDPARKPRQALDALGDLSCPLLGLYGEEDHLIPVADVREMEERLAHGRQPWEVVLYAGAGHAFMNETRPAMYRPDAARDAWSRLVPFLHRHLD
jgi:carboxymethylenebutenolidase